MNETLVKIAWLWQRTSARGTTYMSGKLGDGRLVILPNPGHDPSDPRSPSHYAYISADTRRSSSSRSGTAQSNQTAPAAPSDRRNGHARGRATKSDRRTPMERPEGEGGDLPEDRLDDLPALGGFP